MFSLANKRDMEIQRGGPPLVSHAVKALSHNDDDDSFQDDYGESL